MQRLSPLVAVISGLNPGRFTLNGTNCYLVGRGESRVLIDTGEGGRQAVIDKMREALAQSRLSDVIITHRHYDHVGGLADVLASFTPAPKVHMWPLGAGGRAACKHSSREADGAFRTDLPAGARVHDLTHGGVVAAEGATLRCYHTPGHTDDSICLFLEQEGSLFTGDLVLGAGTAVFSDLARYMESLQLALSLRPGRLYCGHGPVVEDGQSKLREYITHRTLREEQILAQLSTGNLSAPELVSRMYADTHPALHAAAAGNILLHLEKLRGERRVAMFATAGEGEGASAARWGVVASPAPDPASASTASNLVLPSAL